MSSESTLILFGLFVAITPYSGIPTFWYAYILPVFGIVIIGIGFLFRSRRVSSQNDAVQTVPDPSISLHESTDILEHKLDSEPISPLSTSSPTQQTTTQQTAQSSKRKSPSSIS